MECCNQNTQGREMLHNPKLSGLSRACANRLHERLLGAQRCLLDVRPVWSRQPIRLSECPYAGLFLRSLGNFLLNKMSLH